MSQQEPMIRTFLEDGIATITLCRPPVNVLNIAMLSELLEVLNDPALISDARVVVLRAEGKAFSTGVDVADHTPQRTEAMLEVFHAVIARIWELPVPSVALVERAALGGGAELAFSCDLILASDKAKFGQPEILLGVFPPAAIVSLPKTIGMRKAAELIFTGETIHAQEALELALINHVYPAEQFSQSSKSFIDKFIGLSRISLIETKAAFCEAMQIVDPVRALKAVETRYLDNLMATEDAREGITAFMEKRKPVWRHR